MKKLTLFLFSGLLLMIRGTQAQMPAFVAPTTAESHFAACIASLGATCAIHSPVSMWTDPSLMMATMLDIVATEEQALATEHAKATLNKLEESLKSKWVKFDSDKVARDSSLTLDDMNVYAPEKVVKVLNDTAAFDKVRHAVEDYAFETTDADINGECKTKDNRTNRECAVERQNVWSLLSVTLAESMADKVLMLSKDMGKRYKVLEKHFNEQKSPMGMWGAMNSVTVDSHMQMNDLNALYARALEMSSLTRLNESGVKKFERKDVKNSGAGE